MSDLYTELRQWLGYSDDPKLDLGEWVRFIGVPIGNVWESFGLIIPHLRRVKSFILSLSPEDARKLLLYLDSLAEEMKSLQRSAQEVIDMVREMEALAKTRLNEKQG